MMEAKIFLKLFMRGNVCNNTKIFTRETRRISKIFKMKKIALSDILHFIDNKKKLWEQTSQPLLEITEELKIALYVISIR